MILYIKTIRFSYFKAWANSQCRGISHGIFEMLLKLRLPYIDLSAPLRVVNHGLARLHAIRQVVRERGTLAKMDERMLADIGLSRTEAEAEINRKPWDIAPR
jgi:uncharacterized protein YjiS (DUF1127 family)